MSFTKLSLVGNNDVIYKLFPPRESLVSDIPAGDGNIEKPFLRCTLRNIFQPCFLLKKNQNEFVLIESIFKNMTGNLKNKNVTVPGPCPLPAGTRGCQN